MKSEEWQGKAFNKQSGREIDALEANGRSAAIAQTVD